MTKQKVMPKLLHKVSLESLGYDEGSYIEVLLNGPASVYQGLQTALDDYLMASREAIIEMMPEQPEGQTTEEFEAAYRKFLGDLPGNKLPLPDDTDLLLAWTHVFGKCVINGVEWDLSTIEDMTQFDAEGDPHVVRFADIAMAEMRANRLSKSVDAFRGRNSVGTGNAHGDSASATNGVRPDSSSSSVGSGDERSSGEAAE